MSGALGLAAGVIVALAAEPVLADTPRVPLYQVFERRITNAKPYRNKFVDVTLDVRYVAPSGRAIAFHGFYDGDGAGGQNGNVWKIRFMPDEPGTWRYRYAWSDGTPGGSGRFIAVRANSGKGVLKPYEANPRWFAYNGTEPVFLKSYYIGAGGFFGCEIDWAVRRVYRKLIGRGYNHVQMNALPIGWTHQKPADCPNHIAEPLWYDSPETQNLKVWRRMDEHFRFLYRNNIGVHFFMGFDPKPHPSLTRHFGQKRWAAMSAAERRHYVRYVTARLGPNANVAGWNYTWETDGSAGEGELMDLLAEHDPWDHLRTYHDEYPRSHRYGDPRYSFAGIENHGYFGNAGGRPAVDSASHYLATLDAYRGKPVFMVEGNGLWRACWAKRHAATSIPRAAWAVTMAGGSFTWQDTPSCEFDDPSSSMFTWPKRRPMYERLDVLYRVMTQDVRFHTMSPQNGLLSDCDSRFDRDAEPPRFPCFALAEIGSQYLVHKQSGGIFTLDLAAGRYRATWVDARTGARRSVDRGTVSSTGGAKTFTAPSSGDWILLLTRDVGS